MKNSAEVKNFYVLRMMQQENASPVYFVDAISLDQSAVAIYDDINVAYQVANQLNASIFAAKEEEATNNELAAEEPAAEPAPEYPIEEYPSKIVKFDATNTFKLFRRKPNNKQSRTCIFVTEEAVEAFKKAATNKSNYSLEASAAPEMYTKWNNYFNKVIADRNL